MPTPQYGLGLVHSPTDPRDHPLSLHLPDASTVVTPRRYVPSWTIAPLDQGQTPRCVGYSGALGRRISEKIAETETVRFDPDDLYAQSKKIDGSPTEDGTFIRSAASVLKNLGGLVALSRAKGIHRGDRLKISAYSRLVSLQDMRIATVALGGSWLGLDWENNWFDPDPIEYHRTTEYMVSPSASEIAGGHAIYEIGYDDDFPVAPGETGAFLCENSWGDTWAKHGRFWLPYSVIDFSDGSFESWRTFDVVGDL